MSYGVSGTVASNGQGSIMYSNYFKKYILFTGTMGWNMNFHTSDTPYGPWSDEYGIMTTHCYGVNVHPEMSPDGDHKVLYVSSGIGNVITMYKLEFDF